MKLLTSILFLLLVSEVSGQLRGNNLMELQIGNVPGSDPDDLITHYDRFNLSYRFRSFNASVRYEQFVHPLQVKEYYRLTQYKLGYRNKGIELKLGHFNETLGNGILLRSYEIPGAIFEDQAYRVRHGFYRDLRGFMGSYNHKYFKITALRARSLSNTLPPTLEEAGRRPDLSEALQVEGRLLRQNAGIILMRNHNAGEREDFASFFLKGSISGGIAYNMEFAREMNDPDFFSLEENSSYAFYGSLNYSFKSFALSLEYKDYKNIFIGSGISDPPTLIREHGYRVLNRSTHVPELSDESGFQFEAYYSFSSNRILTFNVARTKNELFRDFVFQEYFLELETGLRKNDILRLFIDYSKDPLRSEINRYSSGLLYEGLAGNELGVKFQAEYQFIERRLVESITVHNTVWIASIFSPSQWSFSLNLETSTDPLQTAITEADEKLRVWPGVSGSYQINKENKISFFAGQRRGGPACTSGICYEVLDFQGLEIRLTTKF